MSRLEVVRLRNGQEMLGREPYLSAARTLLDETGCVVAKWRTATTGHARTTDPDWKIESPEPRGPVSWATLAHEVGHQMLHRKDTGRASGPRWLKELEAWEYAIEQFRRFDLPGFDQAVADAAACIEYSAGKALRRTRSADRRRDLARRIAARLPEWVWPALDVRTRVTSPLTEAAS
jgi:hypothetical protein